MTQNGLKAWIGPSILNADLSNLAHECNDLLNCGADYLHLDVMDGHFVNNLTFGHPVVKCLRKHVPKSFFDMHMMVAEPEKWIQDLADCGADQYTFHYESTTTPDKCIRKIKESGMRVGLAIRPDTPVEKIMPFIQDIDMALIMTVQPGKGGQPFMGDMLEKVRFLREKFPQLDIEVDGGVGPSNILECASYGANMIVSGTAIINSKNRQETIMSMKSVVVENLNSKQKH
jgi:ribulose-phosphate 3-epimerase